VTIARTLGLVLLLNTAFSMPAYAYLDPGSGAFLLQILAAMAVGGMVYFQKVRDAIKKLFRIGDKKSSERGKNPGAE